MARKLNYTVPQRRKREGRTNYKRRLSLLVSRQPRLVVRKTLHNVIAQIVKYEADGDHVLVGVNSNHLQEYGLPVINANIPVSYLTGLLLAKQAQAKKITQVVVDIGLQKLTSQSVIYALVKGAREGGLAIKANDEVLPSDERVSGKHIEQYASKLKNDSAAYARQFSAYVASKVDPSTISKTYASVKQSVLAGAKKTQ